MGKSILGKIGLFTAVACTAAALAGQVQEAPLLAGAGGWRQTVVANAEPVTGRGTVKTDTRAVSGGAVAAMPVTGPSVEVATGSAVKEKNGWGIDKSGNRRYYINGKAIKSRFAKIAGKYYYFNKKGICLTGWQTIKGSRYYFKGKGERVSGFVKIDGDHYYFDAKGIMKTGLQKIDGATYYFGRSGRRYSGLKKVGTDKYFFKKNGQALTESFKKVDEARYYFTGSGKAAVGWKTIDEGRYYFKAGGKAVIGWKKLEDKKYYFQAGGKAAVGWKTVDGERYYFNEHGVCLTGIQTIDGDLYYFSPSGKRYAGLKKIDEYVYYFGPSGKAVKSKRKTIDGASYYFDENGRASLNGWQTIGSVLYYADEKGRLAYCWRQQNGVWTLCRADGTAVYTSNVLYAAWQKAQEMSSATPYIILVDTGACNTMIFKGSQGSWLPVQYWACSPGAGGSPTIKGVFATQSKGYVFGSGFSCYYYTQFHGNYLFHSTLYYQGTMTPMDGRLGMNLSHGCVRLDINNAKWIYDNIPLGTKVYTY